MIKKYSIDTFRINSDENSSLMERFVYALSLSFFIMLFQKTKSFSTYILLIFIFFKFNTLQAQVQNDGELYINDNSVIYVEGENFNFGIGSTTTTRTKLDYGVLSFSKGALWSGANDLHFVDGYAQTHSNTPFILPIGQTGFYAPIQVIPSTTDGVDAAYFRSAPNTIGGILDASISSISSVEYWDIKSTGVRTGISLSWRATSAISDLTSSSLPKLTIVGWNGSAWVTIPSVIDEYSILGEISSLVSGSISSNIEVDLSAYSAFSLGTTTKQLLVPKFDKVELTAYVNKSRLFIEASLPITALIIYDILGKKIFSEQLNGTLKYEKPFNHADEIYIVKIQLANGTSLITRKIINKN
jgi:hypothetical protein